MKPSDHQGRQPGSWLNRTRDQHLSILRKAWGGVRLSKWQYMLIFSLAPIFTNMKKA